MASYLNKHGFSLIEVSFNSSQGGSVRFLSQKAKEPVLSTQAKNTIGLEKESKLYQHDLGRNWQLKIKKSMLEFGAAIKKLKFKGAQIICYGAPTKATLLLKLSELTSEEINYIVEDNNLKVGNFLPTTGIPIFSPERLRLDKPEVIIIF